MIVTNVLWIVSSALLYQVHNTPLPEVTETLQSKSLGPPDNNITLIKAKTPQLAVETTPQLAVETTPQLAVETTPKSYPTFSWPIRNFIVLVTYVNITQMLPMVILVHKNVEELRKLFAQKLEIDVQCLSASNDIHISYGGKPMKVNKRAANLPPNNDLTLQFEVLTDKYENCEMLREKLNSIGPLKLFEKPFYPTIVVWEDNSTFEPFSNEIQNSKCLSTNKMESPTSEQFNVHNTPPSEVTKTLQSTSLQPRGNNITSTKATTPSVEKTDTTPSIARKTSPKSFPTFSWPIRNFNILLTLVNITQKLPKILLERKTIEDFRKSIAQKLEVDVQCVANRSDIQFTYEGEPMKINKRSAEAPPNYDVTLQFDVTTDKYENSEMLRKKLETKPIEMFNQVFFSIVLVWEDNSTLELASQTQTTYSLSSSLITETKLQTAEQTHLISTQGSTKTSSKPSTVDIFQTNFHATETPAIPTKSADVKKNNFSLANEGGIILIYLLMLLLLIPVTISIVVGVYCCLGILKKTKPGHLHPVEKLETSNFYQPPLGERPPSYRSNPWSDVISKMDVTTTKESLVSLDQNQKKEEVFYDNRSSSNYSSTRNSSLNNFQQDAVDEIL